MAAEMSGPDAENVEFQAAAPLSSEPSERSKQSSETSSQPSQMDEQPSEKSGQSPLSNEGYSGVNEEGADAPLWFPDKPSKPARLLPPLALAYIGDAVFEIAVRQHVIARPNLRPHHLHIQSTKLVSAKAQARMLALIEPQLTQSELDIVRQGRNAKSGTVPKNANVLDYRHATAFECLIGYLYYAGAHDRLRGLILQGFELLERDNETNNK
ncbi:Mini-ribonuclease 3 [compost metagenome]